MAKRYGRPRMELQRPLQDRPRQPALPIAIPALRGNRLELTNRKKNMKLRLLLALAGLVVGFALPSLAQEQNTVDPG
jgi:hypothetical protein